MTTEEAVPLDMDVEYELDQLESHLDADYRANVAPGTVLGKADWGQGSHAEVLKGSTLVGNPAAPQMVNAPSRIVVYDTRTGMPSKIPYAQRRYHLNKRRIDGSRVFSLTLPADILQPTPIDDTCKICQEARRRNGITTKRNFYTEFDLLNHYQLFHEREWNAMERDRDMRQRREDATRMERLILALATALAPNTADKLPPEVREQIASLQAIPDVEDEKSVRVSRKKGDAGD